MSYPLTYWVVVDKLGVVVGGRKATWDFASALSGPRPPVLYARAT